MTAHAGYHYLGQRNVDTTDRDRLPACRDADPELFFTPEGLRGRAKDKRIEAAKAICASCPLIDECRDIALSQRIQFGTWGGMSEDERALILRPGLTGRPRATEPRERCGNGHPLNAANAYHDPSRPGIRCRACGRDNAARRRERRRATDAAATTTAGVAA